MNFKYEFGWNQAADDLVFEQLGYSYGKDDLWVTCYDNDKISVVFVLFDYRIMSNDYRCGNVELTMAVGTNKYWFRRGLGMEVFRRVFNALPVTRINCIVKAEDSHLYDRIANFLPLHKDGLLKHWYGTDLDATSYYFYVGDF